MGMSEGYNEFEATVFLGRDYIAYSYEHKGTKYSLEVPMTINNKMLVDGQIITVRMSILLDSEEGK